MIEPTDFLKTAHLLKEYSEEWNIRTVVNRCYYAIFLFFRNFLADNQVKIPDHKDKSQHTFISECLKKSKTEAKKIEKRTNNLLVNARMLHHIFSRLNTLLQGRMNSDYRLDLRFHHNYSDDNIRIAESIIEDFESLNEQTERILIETSKQHSKLVEIQIRSSHS